MNLQENILRIKEVMGVISEATDSYDAALVGGIDDKQSYKSLDQQITLLKNGNPNLKNVKGFRYNASTSTVLDFLKSHPAIFIFLFSAGATKAYDISKSGYADKNKIYIIEPYGTSKKTKSIVQSAVADGVPSKNVFVGSSESTGSDIVVGSSLSGGDSHWDALTKVASKIGGNSFLKKNSSNNSNLLDRDFVQSYKFNSEVQELQKQLVDKGYYIGKFGPKGDGVDGKYGPFTQAAHLAFKQNISPSDFKSKRKEMAQEFIGDVEDSVLKGEFNFHRIPDGKNNYRSAQIPVSIKGKDYLGSVIENYGIKTVIRLNGDGGDNKHRSTHPETSIADERQVVESKGAKFYQIYAKGDENQKTVNDLLSQGNVLIHCAHGQDRTGGNVGGYLYKIGFGDTEKIWEYTTKYNGWNSIVKNNPEGFISGGYLTQAKKFGVRNIEHAKDLANKKISVREKNSNKISKNIIIGDSQTPFVDMNTSKASRISTKGGIESLWEGGKTVSWLINALQQFPETPNVANVIIVIGTNGGFGKFAKDNISGLFSLLRQKFPNAKFYVVQGSWGWGGLKNITRSDVKNYYKKFEEQGATLIDPPIGNIEPHGNHPVYSQIGAAIDSLL